MGVPADWASDDSTMDAHRPADRPRRAAAGAGRARADPRRPHVLSRADRGRAGRGQPGRGGRAGGPHAPPPGLERVRKELRRREDPAIRAMEDRAVAGLFALADVYIWLPTSWAYNVWQTEEIIKTWPGRAVHFHWIMDVSMDAGLFRRLSELYDAALWIDYAALTAHQRRVVGALQDAEIEVTDPRGTRLRFELRGAHFHLGNGDASKAFIEGYARPGSARDREVELPAGAIRTVDIERAEGVLVTPPETFAGRQVGRVRLEFSDNRITRLTSEHHRAWLEAAWRTAVGRPRPLRRVQRRRQPQAGRASRAAGDSILRLRGGSDPGERRGQRRVGRTVPVQLPPVVFSDRRDGASQRAPGRRARSPGRAVGANPIRPCQSPERRRSEP